MFSAGVCVEPAAEAFLSSGSQDESEDQSKVIVGVVVGLLIAAGLMGLIYWLYMKNSRCDQDSRVHTHVLHLSPSPEGKMRMLVWLICNSGFKTV